MRRAQSCDARHRTCTAIGPATRWSGGGAGAGVEGGRLRGALAVIRRSGLRVTALPGADVRLLEMASRLPNALARPILARVVGGARGGKSPSLLLTAESGSDRSEVEWLNGAVARAAADLGGVATVNERL